MSGLNKTLFFLICSAGVFTTLAYGTVHQPVIAIFYLFVASLAILSAAESFLSGKLRFSRSVLQIPLLLLGTYAVIQVIPFGTVAAAGGITVPRTISLDPFSTQVVALHIFALCIFFAISIIMIDTAGRLRRIVNVITLFGFLYAFFAILQSVLSPDKIYGIYKPLAGVPFGSFVNKHNYAAIIEMAMGLPMGLIFVGAIRSEKKMLYVVAIALMGSSLLLSGSRGGLVALFAEIILIVILTSRAKGRKNLILKASLSGLLLVAAVGGAIFVGGDTSLTRFSDSITSEDISSSRTHIWAITLKVIGESLPLGAGLGAYAQAYTRFDTSGGYERVEQAHNDYLQIVADAGVVGMIIGALFLFWFFREGIKNARVTNTYRRGIAVGAFAGCFAIHIHSLFDFVLHITAVSVMFLTLAAILVASGREYEDDIDEFDQPRSKRRRAASVSPFEGSQRKGS